MSNTVLNKNYKNLIEVGKFTSQVKNLIEPGVKFTKWEKYGYNRIYINRYEGHAAGNGTHKTEEIGMIDLKDNDNTWFDISKLDSENPKENLIKLIIREYHPEKIIKEE